jgi:uracil-DNA glycosylase
MVCGLVFKVRLAGTLPAQSKFWGLLPIDWQKILEKEDFDQIELSIGSNFQPEINKVFAAFQYPIEDIKVLIVGQDPYPNPNHTMGLAFSVPADIDLLPPTLKNIFKELKNDLNIDRINGDLTDWSSQGVMLLNRALTIGVDGSPSHLNLGWEKITERVIRILASRGVLAILWGKEAEKFSKFFPTENTIVSSHPSPLSAYRGFFGSRPFSRINQILSSRDQSPINW